MSLDKLFPLLGIGLVFCGSAIGQTYYQCDIACLTGLDVTDGTTTSFASCPAGATFTAPCTITFLVTGWLVGAPNGPLGYVLAADTTVIAATSYSCIGAINLPNIDPVFVTGTIPNSGPGLLCGNAVLATDSTITAYFPTGGFSFGIQALVYYSQVGAACDQLTQAIGISIQ